MTTVEKVARAMQAESVGKQFSWESAARAGIAVLREPTPGMISGADGNYCDVEFSCNRAAVWADMIDAALAEGEG